ncbi:notchless-like protein, partial [Trifolium medium]|nr:notchless-like protein [Trifolium medium]
HKNWVLCIEWSPDGKYLVSGSKSGELICWDPQTGKQSGNALTLPTKGRKQCQIRIIDGGMIVILSYCDFSHYRELNLH